MQNFRTYQMAKELHREVKCLALTGELKDQIERASLSVALNLAEGSGRLGNDRLKFFRYAFGSIKEVQGLLRYHRPPTSQQSGRTRKRNLVLNQKSGARVLNPWPAAMGLCPSALILMPENLGADIRAHAQPTPG